jgi:hypothetical protein
MAYSKAVVIKHLPASDHFEQQMYHTYFYLYTFSTLQQQFQNQMD